MQSLLLLRHILHQWMDGCVLILIGPNHCGLCFLHCVKLKDQERNGLIGVCVECNFSLPHLKAVIHAFNHTYLMYFRVIFPSCQIHLFVTVKTFESLLPLCNPSWLTPSLSRSPLSCIKQSQFTSIMHACVLLSPAATHYRITSFLKKKKKKNSVRSISVKTIRTWFIRFRTLILVHSFQTFLSSTC